MFVTTQSTRCDRPTSLCNQGNAGRVPGAGCPTSRLWRRGGFTFTLSPRYSVIPSVVDEPCVCSALKRKCRPGAGCPTSRLWRRGGFTFTLSPRYSVIPSVVEEPCVCSALKRKCRPGAGCPTSRLWRRGGFTFTLSPRYSVIPSVVEGPCVCSALNKQAQVSKSRKRLDGAAHDIHIDVFTYKYRDSTKT